MKHQRQGLLRKAVALIAGTALSLGALTACSSDGDDDAPAKGTQGNPIKLGVVGATNKYWDTFKDELLAEGIYIDIVDFAEYPLPNPALTEGDIDLNQFQHIIFLAGYVDNTGNQLTPIGSTAIYPLSLHSQKYDSVADIPAGAEIAIPNDPTNLSRALIVLQSAGLIKLRDGGSVFSTDLDVITEESRVTVRPVAADLLPSTLADLDGAVMNNDWVVKAGLDINNAIAQDDPNDPAAQPYINIWASRPEDANNELYLRIIELFHASTQVVAELQEMSGGSAAIVNVPATELQTALDKTLADIQSQD